MPTLNLKLDSELHQWAKAAAQASRMSLATFIRQAILEKVEAMPDYKAVRRADAKVVRQTRLKELEEAAKPPRPPKKPFSKFISRDEWVQCWFRRDDGGEDYWMVYTPELRRLAEWLEAEHGITMARRYVDQDKTAAALDVILQIRGRGVVEAFDTDLREFIKTTEEFFDCTGHPQSQTSMPANQVVDFTPPAPPTNTRGRKIYNQLMEIKRATDQHIKPLDPERTRNLYQALETAFTDLSQPSADYAELELVVINLKEICKAGVRNLTGQEIAL